MIMKWLTNLFKRKKKNAFTFTIDPSGEVSVSEDFEKFRQFVRNNYPKVDALSLPDEELKYVFLFALSKTWLADNASKPFFVEERTFESSDNIKYERAWNNIFEQKVSQLGFDVLPSTGEELIEMYLNYLYGTRLIEEAAASQEEDPTSVAHPQLSYPGNILIN